MAIHYIAQAILGILGSLFLFMILLGLLQETAKTGNRRMLTILLTSFMMDLAIWLIRSFNRAVEYASFPSQPLVYIAAFLTFWFILGFILFSMLRGANRSRLWIFSVSLLLGTALDIFQFMDTSLTISITNLALFIFTWMTSVVSTIAILWLVHISLYFDDRKWIGASAAVISIALTGQRMDSLATIHLLSPLALMIPPVMSNSLQSVTMGFDVTFILGLLLGAVLLDRYSVRFKQTLGQLQESELRYRVIAEHSPIAMFVHRDGKILFINDACRLVLRTQPGKDLVGCNVLDFVPSNWLEYAHQRVVYRAQKDVSMIAFNRLDGTLGYVELTGLPIRFEEIEARLVVVVDVTRQRSTELALQENEQKYQVLLETSPIGMVIYQKGTIRYVNPAGVTILGAKNKENIMSTPMRYFTQQNDTVTLRRLFNISETFQRSLQITLRRLDEKIIHVDVVVFPTRFEGEPALQVVFQDITEQKKAADVIHYMAYHDSLTDLPNRILLKQRLHDAIVQCDAAKDSSCIMVAFVDLDRFKNINDTLGHAVGDEVLRSVAHRLQDMVNADAVACRLGGDEFALMLPKIDVDHVIAKATSIRDAFRMPFAAANRSFYVSASIGVAIYPEHGHDADILLQNADIAMYAAKTDGKARYQVYSQRLNDQYVYRNDLEQALQDALLHDEFELYYQPIFAIATHEMVSAEALIRWNRTGHGLVSPGEFIALAEETGLIIALGEWVATQVCLQVKTWLEQGLVPVPIAINVSAMEFQGIDYVERLQSIIDEASIDSRWLQVEITERTVIEDIDHAVVTLQDLRNRGICTALDDFGVGYSSLSYLRMLPVDKLKIDGSFIQDLSQPNNQAIVSAILNLSLSLGLTVVAEGIEREDELQFLRKAQCDHAQGFLLAKPMTTEQMTLWIQDLQDQRVRGAEIAQG